MLSNNKDIEIKEIDQKLAIINQRLSSQNKKIRELVKKRNILNMKLNELQGELRQKKIERDEFNKKVKKLKEKREKIQQEIKHKNEKSKFYKQKLEKLEEILPKRSNRDIQREFNDIEWKIQTTVINLDEEKKLVERVKALGSKLKIFGIFNEQILKIKKIRMEIKELISNRNKTHEELTLLANKSQEIHLIMSSTFNEIKIIKEKKDKIHNSILTHKEEYRSTRNEGRELIEKKKQLLSKIKEKEEKQKKENTENLRKKIKLEAKTKIKNKEKLSWNEFKLLTESDLKNKK